MEFKTGFESGKDDFDEVGLVGCPVTGMPVSADVCQHGPGGQAACNYFLTIEELERGGGKDPKRVLICGAPRPLAVTVGFLQRGGAGAIIAPASPAVEEN